jgi:hypothetical protein
MCRGTGIEADGWTAGEAAPVEGPAAIVLWNGQPAQELVRLQIEPATAELNVRASPEGLHYFRLADATVKPLPEQAVLTLARGDAYIALTPEARRLSGSVSIARFLHLRDYFNAERLAESVLDFIAEGAAPGERSETLGVIVIEAR